MTGAGWKKCMPTTLQREDIAVVGVDGACRRRVMRHVSVASWVDVRGVTVAVRATSTPSCWPVPPTHNKQIERGGSGATVSSKQQ